MKTTEGTGTVWLVGAGPGDPELLTLKAARLLQQADVVLHDSLVSRGILNLLPKDCRRIHTGKRCGAHRMPQARINALMHRYALRYCTVVRLKGGDPFIFGRGGEELEYLRERNIAVEVVPGITAAAGCAAACQVPLTHRGLGDALLLHSGHSRDGGFAPARDYTRVFYMGLGQAGEIQRTLMEKDGLSGDTPVVVILAGTTPEQRIIPGRLDELHRLAGRTGNGAPGLIIVGRSAGLVRTTKPIPLLSTHVA